MPKTWNEMTVEEKLDELHRGKQDVVLGLARLIEEMCNVVQRLDEEFAEFRRKLNLPAESIDDGLHEQTGKAKANPRN